MVFLRCFRQLRHQRFVVVGFKFVCVQIKQVGEPHKNTACLEESGVVDQRVQQGEAAGAAAFDDQFIGVSQPGSDQSLAAFIVSCRSILPQFFLRRSDRFARNQCCHGS